MARGVERLVASSSASVYGDSVREPMDEVTLITIKILWSY